MTFPPEAQAAVDAIYAQHPELATGSEDQQRLLMRLMAEQIAFRLGPGYGVKAAGVGRPQGPSQIAFAGPPLGGWRILDGDGSVTGTPGKPIPNPPWQLFPDQVFIPVTPQDHLGSGHPPSPPPAPMPAATDLGAVLERLDRLEAFLAALAMHLDQHAPSYVGRLGPITVVLRPVP